jgi:DNA-binding protein Alba
LLSREPVIIVGRKPAIRYVTACVTVFNRGEKSLLLRARGKRISNCIDVVNLLRKSFITNLSIKDIVIGTEVLKESDKYRYISFIEIRITR